MQQQPGVALSLTGRRRVLARNTSLLLLVTTWFSKKDDATCEVKGGSKVLPRTIKGNGNGHNGAICVGIGTTYTASFLTKKLNIGGKRVNLAIWDTAGQERFHALGPIYYRDSNGAILVYDITDEDSFQKVKNWVKELRKMLGNEICLCIVGNKIDLEKERHVSVQEAETYAESVGAKHYHTSAKQNKGIEELFLDLCKRMIETAQVDERARGNGSSQSGIARRGVQIIDDEPQVQSSGGCCSSG
ncbi:PREDICTED: ras-related protein Rab-21 [Pygoscelis adeliae]|uniref:ras-related protein Rab-21 n=1 Tax=Pygoscelis adeliae TaxID=9238 RepID=UPI0004F4E96A|nr:PREDICTED: ras-related protein Rab-21 [Pygoscelis adeliae]